MLLLLDLDTLGLLELLEEAESALAHLLVELGLLDLLFGRAVFPRAGFQVGAGAEGADEGRLALEEGDVLEGHFCGLARQDALIGAE